MSQVCADGVEYDKTWQGGMHIEVTGAPTFECDFGNGFVEIDLTASTTYPVATFGNSKCKYRFSLNGGTAFTKPEYA